MDMKKNANLLGFREDCGQICRMACADAVLTVDAEGRISSFNHGAQGLFGYQSADVVGEEFSRILKGGEAEAQRIQRWLESAEQAEFLETDVLCEDERTLPVQLTASLLKDKEGHRSGFVVICHDISPIRNLESEIRQKDQFFDAILRHSADAILTLDNQDRVTSWNKGAEAIFGYTEKEMLGQSLDVILPERLKEQRELEKISQLARAQGHLSSYQTKRVTKDGRMIDVVFSRSAIRDEEGNLIGFSSILRDVTEERLIARHLTQMEKLSAIGELAAGLAHEIKNPLAGIKGAIEIIRDSMREDHPHRKVLAEVLSEVGRIDRIVMDLLFYAKPKSSDFVPLDVVTLIRNVVNFIRKMAAAKSIQIDFQPQGAIPRLTGDENDLKQLILNLLFNAIEAVPARGLISISVSATADSKIMIEVSDNGPGIPAGKLSRIFAPFFTTKKNGTGLGLATCRRIVTNHGGEIRVTSEEGKGANFIVELPLHYNVPMSLAAQ